MNLRYKVNQAACFKAGINQEKSIEVLPVNPAELSQEIRDLVASRLCGIDVVKLEAYPDGSVRHQKIDGEYCLIESQLPGLEHLVAACRENEAEVQKSLTQLGFGNSAVPVKYGDTVVTVR